MTKPDELRDAMLCIIVDCVNGQEHDSEKVIAKVDELLQAVRDEEALLSNKLLKEALYQAELEAARANRAEDKIKWMSERIDQLNAALFVDKEN